MNLPFSTRQFLDVFTAYNNAVWPLQILLYCAALLALITAWRGFPHSDRIAAALLGILWLWSGIVYHIVFFSRINPAAYVFGGLFIVQGILFLRQAQLRTLLFTGSSWWNTAIAAIVLCYGLLIYPLLGHFSGHVFPAAPSFGAPCPMTIFTFGMLILARKYPRHLLVIPVIWSLIGFTAAVSLGFYEDIGLPVAGLLAVTRRGFSKDLDAG